MTENEIGKQVVEVPVRADREVGPGLLTTVDEAILTHAQSALPEEKD